MVQELSATEYLNQLLQDKTTVSKMPKYSYILNDCLTKVCDVTAV